MDDGTLGGYSISGDQRYAHLVAFSSNAPNIVSGASGRRFTVFVTRSTLVV